MALEFVLAAALAATVGLLLVLGRRLLKLKAELQRLESDLQRALADGRQQAERLASLERLREAQATAEQMIEAGGTVVRDVHKGIASIPFDVLESIPAARDRARAVRGLHDSITDGVYGALASLNRAVGRELRKGMKPVGEDDSQVGPVRPDAPPPEREPPQR